MEEILIDNVSLRQKNKIVMDLADWHVHLQGEWKFDEIKRIHTVLQRMCANSNKASIPDLFNQQPSVLHHAERPGTAGRTRGKDIFLDQNWTDWTLAHELGHRWNNAWNKTPESILRQSLDTGRLEWLKKRLRNFEKWLRSTLQKAGIKWNIDWKALWYHPGAAPPPCGVDRNFDSGEDLAESFAASVFPEEGKQRARRAAARLKKKRPDWDWGSAFEDFWQTPRGKVIQMLLASPSGEQDRAEPTNHTPAKDQP